MVLASLLPADVRFEMIVAQAATITAAAVQQAFRAIPKAVKAGLA